jgi:chromosome segregation ATPase
MADLNQIPPPTAGDAPTEPEPKAELSKTPSSNTGGALTEPEAKAFIKECVNRLIVQYAAAFGLVNVVAVVALFYSVTQVANTAAKSEAQRYVDESLKLPVQFAQQAIQKSVDDAKKATDDALSNVKQFAQDYPHLLAQKEILEGEIADLQKSIATVKDIVDKGGIKQLQSLVPALKEFSDADTKSGSVIEGMLKTFESLKSSLASAESNLTVLGGMRNDIELLKSRTQQLERRAEKLELRAGDLGHDFTTSVGALKQEMNDKMSISKVYQAHRVFNQEPDL